MNFQSPDIGSPCNCKLSTEGRKKPVASWSTARSMTCLVVTALIATISLGGPGGARAFAKSGKQDSPAAASKMDSRAMDALNAMGTYLRTLQAFQVQAVLATDDVTDDGQTIQFATNVDLLVSKPNRMRLQVTGDETNRLYLYDGKNFTIYGQLVNYYATVPAPPTIKELIDKIRDRFDIDLPLVDLFQWGTDESDIKNINGAADIGPTSVGGITCEQYAFHQENIDWQIWIQLGQYPLPRKLVIRTLSDDAKPQHSEVLTWNLAPSFNDGAFAFDPPPDAHKILLDEVKPQSADTR